MSSFGLNQDDDEGVFMTIGIFSIILPGPLALLLPFNWKELISPLGILDI